MSYVVPSSFHQVRQAASPLAAPGALTVRCSIPIVGVNYLGWASIISTAAAARVGRLFLQHGTAAYNAQYPELHLMHDNISAANCLHWNEGAEKKLVGTWVLVGEQISQNGEFITLQAGVRPDFAELNGAQELRAMYFREEREPRWRRWLKGLL